jgi:hypothetical protein
MGRFTAAATALSSPPQKAEWGNLAANEYRSVHAIAVT